MSPNVLTGCLLHVELEESQLPHEVHISELREINSNHRQCLVSCSILSEFPGYGSQNRPTPHLLYLSSCLKDHTK